MKGQYARHSSSGTPDLTTMHACKQESCWFEPCVTSLLQQWLCAAQRAWH